MADIIGEQQPDQQQLMEARKRQLEGLVQAVLQYMERARAHGGALMNLASEENKVLIKGMCVAAITASEHACTATYNAVMARVESVFQQFVTPLEVASKKLTEDLAVINTRMDSMEKTLKEADEWVKDRIARLDQGH